MVSTGAAGTAEVEAGKERLAGGMLNPPMGLEKMAPRDSLGCSRCDGVRTRPAWLGMTATTGTGWLDRGIADCLVWCLPLCAGLELADRDNLVPGSDSDDEGVGAAAQDGIGTIMKPDVPDVAECLLMKKQ